MKSYSELEKKKVILNGGTNCIQFLTICSKSVLNLKWTILNSIIIYLLLTQILLIPKNWSCVINLYNGLLDLFYWNVQLLNTSEIEFCVGSAVITSFQCIPVVLAVFRAAIKFYCIFTVFMFSLVESAR